MIVQYYNCRQLYNPTYHFLHIHLYSSVFFFFFFGFITLALINSQSYEPTCPIVIENVPRMTGGEASSAAVTVQALFRLIREIGRISGAGFGGILKRDCSDLARRVGLLSHLIEEIRDSKLNFGKSASSCYSDLYFALHAAKQLLLSAGNLDFKTSSDVATKKMISVFQSVTSKLEKALENMPYHHFDISVEVQEQVDLVRTQLRRANEKYLGSVTSNSIILLKPLANEMKPTRNRVIEENSGNNDYKGKIEGDGVGIEGNASKGYGSDQMIHKLQSMRLSSASAELCQLNNVNSDDTKKLDSPTFPLDFLCPISLELMRDPVIVATGQTYERSYIQRWIDCGNTTCPKTQQKLNHMTLTPNNVLRNLITQWCIDHKVEQPMVLANGRIKKSDGSLLDVSDDFAAIQLLVRNLSSLLIEERRASAGEIRSLSKRSTDNRILIAEAGAIPVLVNLLTSEDTIIQEHAVTSILNLSIYENNKGLIMLAGAVPSIVQVLRSGTMATRENSAATLFSLSLADENKIIIGSSGAIPALVELLENGSPRGKKDAATALFNLCIYQGNKGRAVRAGIVSVLLKMLTVSSSFMVDEALTILSILSSHPEAKVVIVKAGIIPILIDLIKSDVARNQENAASTLVSLCKRDKENLSCINKLGAIMPLMDLAESGTERGKRKANYLLESIKRLGTTL